MKYFFKLLIIKLKMLLYFKGDSLTWIFANILRSIVELLTITILFSNVSYIENYNFNECLVVYSLYSMVSSLFYCFFAWTFWFSNSYLISGRLSSVIIKPVNPFIYIIGENIAVSELIAFIIGVVLYIFSTFLLSLSFYKTIILFLCVIPSTLAVAGVFLIVSSLSYKLYKLEEVFSPLINFLDYAQYPTSIYPSYIKIFLTWVIPYSLIAYYPTAVVFGKTLSIKEIIYLPIYGLFIFILGLFLFLNNIKLYQDSGN